MKLPIHAAALLLLPLAAQAQDKYTSLDIHTNAVCDMCEKTIETEMLYVKGVHAVQLDLASNTIHVEYKAKKTGPDALRQAVAKMGYMADNVLPDDAARKALPACCQAEGCGLPGAHKSDTAAPAPEAPPAAPVAPVAPER
jgi:mercuric ion binding protein